MSHLLVTVTLLSLQLPMAETFKATNWQPVFTESSRLEFHETTLALLTHASLRFDPLGQTRAAVSQTVSAMKAANLPVVYLHDRHNTSNPPWMYLYDDWTPTAYVASDIGHVDLKLANVEHVVCLGGFYGQCERATVTDVIRLWYADGLDHDFRVTQIVDGTFTVAQHVNSEDTYCRSVRDFLNKELKTQHPDAVLSVEQIMSRIDSFEQTAEFLQRQLPAVPDDVNVVMDILGRAVTLQAVCSEAVTLTFSYRLSDDFLNQELPDVDIDAPIRWVRATSFRKAVNGAGLLPVVSPPVFYGPSEIYLDGNPVFVPFEFGPGEIIISN